MMLNDFQCHFGLSVNVKRADELARHFVVKSSIVTRLKLGYFMLFVEL